MNAREANQPRPIASQAKKPAPASKIHPRNLQHQADRQDAMGRQRPKRQCNHRHKLDTG